WFLKRESDGCQFGRVRVGVAGGDSKKSRSLSSKHHIHAGQLASGLRADDMQCGPYRGSIIFGQTGNKGIRLSELNQACTKIIAVEHQLLSVQVGNSSPLPFGIEEVDKLLETFRAFFFQWVDNCNLIQVQ